MADHERDQLAQQAYAVAARLLPQRFDGAAFAFAAGSLIRGQGTGHSDIDLVVVYPALARAWRESFFFDGLPVEAFVQDPETLDYFMEEDLKSRCPIMISMVATGTILGPDIRSAEVIQAEARAKMAAGPPPFKGPSYETLRYQISDHADDLRGERPAEEHVAIAALLHQKLADLILLGRGRWTARGKWIPRALNDLDAKLAAKFNAAFADAFQGNTKRLIGLVEGELESHGGHFFNGFKLEAPLEARRRSE
ncbi:nucleotidyltransferase domain-containing protein [Oryzifoliimicrobium ureilyticus]|uniref:nucleotidyltransferase domain-containing protein n=1 Tax=Oryzifoliimicrobium ureilyticus TaxID=3113724 RepID=UPI0030764A16